jgi:hypothetical protein
MNMELPTEDDIKSMNFLPSNRGILSPKAPRVNFNSHQRITSPTPRNQRQSLVRGVVDYVQDGNRIGNVKELGTPISDSKAVNLSPKKTSILDSIPDSDSAIPTIRINSNVSHVSPRSPGSSILSGTSSRKSPVQPRRRTTPIVTIEDSPIPETRNQKSKIPEEPKVSEPQPQPKKKKKKKKNNDYDYFCPSTRTIPDYSNLSDINRAKRWAEFEWQFNQIRDHLPSEQEIRSPDMTKESLEECHARYNQYLDNIAKYKFINEESDKNRFYLVLFWATTEIVLIIFGINAANGYTNLQIMLSSQYDLLLMRLGEKRWIESGSGGGGSPIYDMVLSSLITLGIFLFIKFVTSMLGEEESSKISSYLIGEMVRKRQTCKPGAGPLTGIGDVLEMLSSLKGNLSNGQGFNLENMMGMMGNMGNMFKG